MSDEEMFWCVYCKGHFTIELEVEDSSGLFVKLTCGHVGIKKILRNLTRHHKDSETIHL